MTTFTKLGSEIMRDYVTDGVPASGAHSPVKADMRAWMATVEDVVEQANAADDLTAFGSGAGASNGTPTSTPSHSADLNTFIGVNAGTLNTTGFAQTFLGHGAGAATTTGDSNTYLGAQAGLTGTTAKWNVAIGVDAMFSNIYGWNCVVIGHHAGLNLAFADAAGETVVIGAEAMNAAAGAVQSVAIGYRAAYNLNASGTGAVMIGRLAGFTTTSGLNNTFLGNSSGFTNATGQSNVFLGAFSGYYETGSNKLMIDNTNRSNEADARLKAMFYGEFSSSLASQYAQVNGGFVVADGALPTGGNKGAGTINAKDVYNDNVALTCFGIEYLLDGRVDVAKWDAFLPEGRENLLVRRFESLTRQFDPRKPDQYLDFMRKTRSLPGMPTQQEWEHNAVPMGELMNRLWLAAELQASAFAGYVVETTERLEKMETRVARY